MVEESRTARVAYLFAPRVERLNMPLETRLPVTQNMSTARGARASQPAAFTTAQGERLPPSTAASKSSSPGVYSGGRGRELSMPLRSADRRVTGLRGGRGRLFRQR